MTDENFVDLGSIAAKARLFDEFPPSNDAITVKLVALALTVRVMQQVFQGVEERLPKSSIDELDGVLRSLDMAARDYNERLLEFNTMHALIRAHVDGAELLGSWREYVKQYDEQVKSSRNPD